MPQVVGVLKLQLPSQSYPTLQSALSKLPLGKEVHLQLAAGLYAENLSLSQRGVTVEGAGETLTFLDGQKLGSVFQVVQGKLSLKALTVQNGKATEGGGLKLRSVSGTLEQLTLKDNVASCNTYECEAQGGGIYLSGSGPSMKRLTLTRNEVQGTYARGAGLWLAQANPELEQLRIVENVATCSGWGSLYSACGAFGGGIGMVESAPALRWIYVADNQAFAEGGYRSWGSGGGIFAERSTLSVTQAVIQNNSALTDSGDSAGGGGVWLGSSQLSLAQGSVTGNTVKSVVDTHGAGFLMDRLSVVDLSNSVVAYNGGTTSANIGSSSGSSSPGKLNAHQSLLYNPAGWKADNVVLSGTYLTAEPKFLRYADVSTGAVCTPSTSTKCLPSDVHPALGSPLIGSGDASLTDADGSRSDMGRYGGASGDEWELDGDLTPDYFWPGEWNDAPSGFRPADYDCDDMDAQVKSCSP